MGGIEPERWNRNGNRARVPVSATTAPQRETGSWRRAVRPHPRRHAPRPRPRCPADGAPLRAPIGWPRATQRLLPVRVAAGHASGLRPPGPHHHRRSDEGLLATRRRRTGARAPGARGLAADPRSAAHGGGDGAHARPRARGAAAVAPDGGVPGLDTVGAYDGRVSPSRRPAPVRRRESGGSGLPGPPQAFW